MPNSLPAPSGPSFSQSSAIAFSILIGFIVFITCRGQLGAYFSVFLGAGGAGDNPGAASSGGASSGSLIGGVTSGEADDVPFSGGDSEFDTGEVDTPMNIFGMGTASPSAPASSSEGDIPLSPGSSPDSIVPELPEGIFGAGGIGSLGESEF